NPQSGEAIKIAASKAVRFRAGKAVKDALNEQEGASRKKSAPPTKSAEPRLGQHFWASITASSASPLGNSLPLSSHQYRRLFAFSLMHNDDQETGVPSETAGSEMTYRISYDDGLARDAVKRS